MAINPFDSPSRDRLQSVPLDKILLGIGMSYLGWVILWLSGHLSLPGTMTAEKKVPAQGEISARDRAFITYLQQSLKKIDRNQTAHSQPNPPLAIASYPQATTPTLIQPSLLATRIIPPSPIAPSTAAISVTPAQQPLKSHSPSRSFLPPPAPPKVTLSPASSTHPLPPPAEPLTTLSATATNHNLVGLLEAGEQSTVLVTFNGMTRRFTIGETLGNSGWRLISVSDQKAIISRNGMTRSLDVGQKF